MSRKPSLFLLVSAIAFTLAACGNKGPLVLPDKTQEPQDKAGKKDSPASVPQPATQAGGAANSH